MGDVLLVGWDDVSASDATAAVCPRLAAFRETAYEVQAFSHPVCSQSRQAILFGSFGKKIGTWQDIGTMLPTAVTPAPTLPTLPGVLRAAGYSTCLVGKWHCGPRTDGLDWATAPFERGYDEWHAGTRLNLGDDGGSGYQDWSRVDAIGSESTIVQSAQYVTQAQLDAATAWWNTVNAKRRFLHVAFNAPHAPFHVPPASLLAGWPQPTAFSSNRAKFQAMLRTADTAFGELLDLVGPDVAVFLYSDNGTASRAVAPGVNPDHAKETTFDPGIRVLTVGRWGNNPIGSGGLSHLVDIGAGVCAAAGVTPAPEWDSKTTTRGYILSEAQLSDGSIDRCCRTPTMKLRQITPVGGGPVLEELYDLVGDPGETTPLDLADPDEAAALSWLRTKLALASL